MNTKLSELIGKRILYGVHVPDMDGRVHEGRVQELSPSGKYVGLSFNWWPVERVEVLEVLPEEERTEKLQEELSQAAWRVRAEKAEELQNVQRETLNAQRSSEESEPEARPKKKKRGEDSAAELPGTDSAVTDKVTD